MAVKTPRETYPGEGRQKFKGEHLLAMVGCAVWILVPIMLTAMLIYDIFFGGNTMASD